MIEFKNVSYTYYSKFYTLFEFSHIFNKQNYCLIGEDIAGPLTLIRILAKLDTAYKGEILINGISLAKTNYKKDYAVAYISARPVFFENKSVLDNIAYPLKSRAVNKTIRFAMANEALARFNWQDIANIKVKDLNYQQKLTLSLIRASVRKLDLLLCENIFDNVSIDYINKINAGIKIIVSPSNLKLVNFENIYFNLGSKQNSAILDE